MSTITELHYCITKAITSDEIVYCPECGWNAESDFFPGNNGLVVKYWCSFCGWFGTIKY
jgi:predicted RNA-binding Zn-ribbon protein involved in translation (DUF1610 family)